MTDRDRLIELISKSDILCDDCGEYGNSYCTEALADYLLANGVIVPPCKVGDTVYSIQGFDGKPEQCEPYEVTDITIYENNLVVVHITDNLLFTRNMYVDDFGETVFLTKEEAERELKKRGEQNACND